MKGQLEEDCAGLGFGRMIVFKPGILLRKDTDRTGERIIARVLKFVNALGIARRYRPLPTEILAEKLAGAPKKTGAGKTVVELDKVFGF